MAITWFKKVETFGKATLQNNYIVINKLFSDKFSQAYVALVGIDENNNLLVKPLSLDESESPQYKDSLFMKISCFNTFVRIGNVSTMKIVQENLAMTFPKNGIKCNTSWNEKEKALVIETGGK